MPLDTQFSFNLELAKILPIRAAVTYTGEALVELVGSLKASGSDFLIEEDLATIFGRGKIDSVLENKFQSVVRINSISPLYGGSDIVLNSGPGPTVGRAFKNRFYMASVIQLSFLAWIHEERSLAAALVDCMRIRYEMRLPGAAPEPGYDDIIKTLQVCSSQTSHFHWDTIVNHVKGRLPKSVQFFERNRRENQCNIAMFLPANILLGTMDYLYMVQSLPEDRFILVDRQQGLVPLVVWAHFILSLSVSVEGGPDGVVVFGDSRRPQVVIKWVNGSPDRYSHNYWYTFDAHEVHPQAIYLLDGNGEVLLERSKLLDNGLIKVDGQERHRLSGYGTAFLYRRLCKAQLLADDNALLTETANLAVSNAIAFSRRLRRPLLSTVKADIPRQNHLNVELWRLFKSAEMLFSGLKLDKSTITENSKKIAGFTSADVRFPSAINSWLEQDDDNFLPIQPKDSISAWITELSSWIIAFGQVENIEVCAHLPMVRDTTGSAVIPGISMNLLKSVDMDHRIWMNLILHLMDGNTDTDRGHRSEAVFLESRKG